MSGTGKITKRSFARPVNQLVTASFAVTFLVVYILSIVILMRIVDDMKKYYIGAAILLVIYLILLIAASVYVTARINAMFAPLDRVSSTLTKEKQYEAGDGDLKSLAESLKEQNERISNISRELRDTKEDLDNAFRENRLSREGARLQSQRMMNGVKQLGDRQESINEISSRMEESLELTIPLQLSLNEKKSLVYDETKSLKEALTESGRLMEDHDTTFDSLNDGFDQLDGIADSGNALLESMYNEMTLLQSFAAQLNLYAMNTSLDMARAGVLNMQVSGALDEIKQLSSKMSAKTDEVMLQAIQIRNTLKLTKEQTDDLRDRGGECRENNERLAERFDAVAESIGRLVENNEEMADDIAKLNNSVYDMMILEQKRMREEQKLADSLKEYGNTVKEKAVMPLNMNKKPEEKKNGNDNDSEDPGSRRGTRQSGGRTADNG